MTDFTEMTNKMIGDDFTILADKTENGVRHITAKPSALVCSQQLDFDLDAEGKIHNFKSVRGCNGNLQAIGRLLEGMDAAKAAGIFAGINCKERGTSCTDQLSRIIRSL